MLWSILAITLTALLIQGVVLWRITVESNRLIQQNSAHVDRLMNAMSEQTAQILAHMGEGVTHGHDL